MSKSIDISLKRKLRRAVLGLEILFDFQVSMSDKMQLTKFLADDTSRPKKIEGKEYRNFILNYGDSSKVSIVHFLWKYYPQIHYSRVEEVLKNSKPSETLNKELYELRNNQVGS